MVVPKEGDIGGEFSVLVRLSDDPSARLTYKVLQYFGMDGRDGHRFKNPLVGTDDDEFVVPNQDANFRIKRTAEDAKKVSSTRSNKFATQIHVHLTMNTYFSHIFRPQHVAAARAAASAPRLSLPHRAASARRPYRATW
jgi:hypothetical protein